MLMMTKIELYEPALCCETGVCGPNVRPELLTITAAFKAMAGMKQLEANRYNLNSTPDQFAKNETVLSLMNADIDNLPITLVDGQVVKTGAYPTLAELTDYTGLVFMNAAPAQDSGCCGGSDGCC